MTGATTRIVSRIAPRTANGQRTGRNVDMPVLLVGADVPRVAAGSRVRRRAAARVGQIRLRVQTGPRGSRRQGRSARWPAEPLHLGLIARRQVLRRVFLEVELATLAAEEIVDAFVANMQTSLAGHR